MHPAGQSNNPINRLTSIINTVIDGGTAGCVLTAGILRPTAFIFEAAVRGRSQYYRLQRQRVQKLPCRVVSVGNLTAGGTGKTPLCVYLARMIHDAGYRVAIISRGYRGAAEKCGAVVAKGASGFADARQYGDEPALTARLLAPRPIPIYVGRDRIASGRRAIKRFRPEVILLDDGFQHHRLARDLDIVLLDGQKPLGNGHLLPRGPLREPPSALRRADIIVMTRCPAEASGRAAVRSDRLQTLDRIGLGAKPLFASRHKPAAREWLVTRDAAGFRSRPLELGMLKGLPVMAFAGIARGEAFRQTLSGLGADLRGWQSFRDHHAFRADEIDRIVGEGRQRGAAALVTTDKDRMRIQDEWIRELPLAVIGVEIDLGSRADAFARLVFKRLDLENNRKMCR